VLNTHLLSPTLHAKITIGRIISANNKLKTEGLTIIPRYLSHFDTELSDAGTWIHLPETRGKKKKWQWRALPVSKWEIWNTTPPLQGSSLRRFKYGAGRSLYKITYNGKGSSRKEKQTRSCGKNLRHLHNFQYIKRFATANCNLMSASNRYVRYSVITLTTLIILICKSVTVLGGRPASPA